MKSTALIGGMVVLFLFACISIALIGCSASVMDSARIGVAAEPNSMAKREPGAVAPARPDAKRARPPAAPPGGGPSLDEEVWVIAKSGAQQQADDDDAPGSGALVTKIDGQEKHVPVPLKHTEVQANIDGYIASVNVKQQFHNPFSEKIEALYVFPLPQNAAVNEFVMTVGDRKIRGIIRERQEAEKIYREARRQGYVASLMTQERANIFTQRVANIEPGKQIEIDVKYFNTMS